MIERENKIFGKTIETKVNQSGSNKNRSSKDHHWNYTVDKRTLSNTNLNSIKYKIDKSNNNLNSEYGDNYKDFIYDNN